MLYSPCTAPDPQIMDKTRFRAAESGHNLASSSFKNVFTFLVAFFVLFWLFCFFMFNHYHVFFLKFGCSFLFVLCSFFFVCLCLFILIILSSLLLFCSFCYRFHFANPIPPWETDNWLSQYTIYYLLGKVYDAGSGSSFLFFYFFVNMFLVSLNSCLTSA